MSPCDNADPPGSATVLLNVCMEAIGEEKLPMSPILLACVKECYTSSEVRPHVIVRAPTIIGGTRDRESGRLWHWHDYIRHHEHSQSPPVSPPSTACGGSTAPPSQRADVHDAAAVGRGLVDRHRELRNTTTRRQKRSEPPTLSRTGLLNGKMTAPMAPWGTTMPPLLVHRIFPSCRHECRSRGAEIGDHVVGADDLARTLRMIKRDTVPSGGPVIPYTASLVGRGVVE